MAAVQGKRMCGLKFLSSAVADLEKVLDVVVNDARPKKLFARRCNSYRIFGYLPALRTCVGVLGIFGCLPILPQICHAQLVSESQDLFIHGENGYHTYRIPAMVQAPDGTLYAFAEARKNSPGDSGDIDLVMRRSADNGETWLPMQLVFDDGDNTIGQPTPIVDRTNGQLLLIFCKNNREMFVSRYDADTRSFAAPVDITAVAMSLEVPFAVKRLGAGPTAGVQTNSGRLLAPVWINGGIGVASQYRVGTIYSDDAGKTWLPGGVPEVTAEIAGINESSIVVLSDGLLYMTQRTNSGVPNRSFSTSDDGGKTWTKAKLLPQIDSDMTAVKAGLTAVEARGVCDVSGLLLSAPEGPGRSNLAMWYSSDSEQWSHISRISSGPAGYSELIQLQDGLAGVLFERGQQQYSERLSFARMRIDSDTLTK
jgi:sialidase-1